ncbi:MAG TPA: GIY-YIG nuclease family protein [Methanocorpusculum sp.]|nr:GIY-YIG nuclease family protein [Methanocorpusculum sp.]
MKKGIYCLLVKNSVEQSIRVGALGTIMFPAGYYIYVGSALGSGGLSRVSRHIRFFHEHYRKPKWHIDYLTMNAVLEKTFCAETEERLECVLSAVVGGNCIPRFGCSDCDCVSHLYYRKENPEEEIRKAFEKLRLTAAEHQVS